MSHAPLDRFVEAFNRQELEAVRDVLAEDATARVVDSPFPVEQGRDAIAEVSLPYLFESGTKAFVAQIEGKPGVILRTDDGRGPVDVVVVVGTDTRTITRLDYVVAPHQPARFAAVCKALGLPGSSEASP